MQRKKNPPSSVRMPDVSEPGLYDYPEIAKESPRATSDGIEVDEMPTLRILTLTGEEKREMRGVNDHERQLLERSQALSEASVIKLHGLIRALPAPATAVVESVTTDFER